MVGNVLTGVDASWLGGAVSHSHQWYRCVGAHCGPISGATGQQYTVSFDDVSARLRFADSATNASGSFGTASRPTTHVVSMQPENANGGKIAYAIAGGGLWVCERGRQQPDAADDGRDRCAAQLVDARRRLRSRAHRVLAERQPRAA